MADELNQIEISLSNPFEQEMAVGKLRSEIEALIQDAKDDIMSSTCCIYKVPRSIREKNGDIYTPTTISIGPFHYGDGRLKAMERYKVIMLKRFSQRKRIGLDNLISFVKHLEPMVHASYSEDTKMSEDEFQKLMLLDGAFIIELFWSNCSPTNDAMYATLLQPKLRSDIMKDLLLLENQLPFHFLKALYELAFPDEPSFIWLSYMFFDSLNIQRLEPNSYTEFIHFTDLLRLFHLPKLSTERELSLEDPNDVLLYSAKQLAEVGLGFKAGRSVGPLELRFSNNVLEVPRILVGNDTAMIFHNMIAFEQCHYPYEHYICDYALLLDCLIDSQEDVNVLISNGIIRNSLGDPLDVVRIFDGFSTNLALQGFNSEYSYICRMLNDFASDPWQQMKRAFKRQLLLSITGFVLNVLTLIQTLFSILQVARR